MDQLLILMLAILASPLLFALVCVLAQRGGVQLPRRVALWCSLLHLLGSTALTVMLTATLADRPDSGQRYAAEQSFRPLLVPGDAEATGVKTSLTLLEVAPSALADAPAAIQFFIGVDGLNLWLVALTSLMIFLAVLVSWESTTEKPGSFYAWLFVLETAVIGAFLSFDVVLFYVFFELTLIPSFFLIGHWGLGGAKRDAARKFFLYTLFGSLLTLAGLIGIILTNPTPLDPRATKPSIASAGKLPLTDPLKAGDSVQPSEGPVSFSVLRLMKNVTIWNQASREAVARERSVVSALEKSVERLPNNELKAVYQARIDEAREAVAEAERQQRQRGQTQTLFFFLLIAGFLVKVPVVPFHTWLPAAYGEAPFGVVMVFSAIMAKLGTLGLIRIVIPLAPVQALEFGLPTIGFLGAIGIIYAALCAYAQRDIKLLAAYSSVSHLGLLILGTFALNKEGITGSALHMVNHGLTAGAMFALLGFLHDRYRTTDSNYYSGLIGQYPLYAFFMIVICLASVGLPGLNNFVSEMLLLSSLFTPWNVAVNGYALAIAAALGLFFSAWYTFSMVRKVFFGPLHLPSNPAAGAEKDANVREVVAFGLPCLLALAMGLYPQPIIDTMKADVAVITHHVDHVRQVQDQPLADQETPPRMSPPPLNSR